ncbi:serpin family protein [Streptomyces sp. NPDC004539]|uniref:serpin family protein n=1 Tax=Streptomyces sp. NPDC004539 TaxID=3154280 RepID=UPI00339E2ACD
MRTAVRAVNGLTSRWAGAAGAEGGTAFSAAGVWPLLAFLADGADGPARAELAAALGVPAGEAAGLARELSDGLAGVAGLDSALGLWTARTLRLREEWASRLPSGTRGVLGGDPVADRAALDAWAREHTGGRIEEMPVSLDESTLLVLASALALRTRWAEPFHETILESAVWGDREYLGLRRDTADLDRLSVSRTPFGSVTEVRVLGEDGLDVHLLLGETEMTPTQILRAGVELLSGGHLSVPGSRLPLGEAGPGVRVVEVPCTRPSAPELSLATAAFELTARHDLLKQAELFGLGAARDTSYGHFPGVSDSPLAVSSAEQSVVARFHARGFEAEVVTLVAAAAGGLPEYRWTTKVVEARFDRPFGFLAVHRETGLVLVSGWVGRPVEWREQSVAAPSNIDLPSASGATPHI